MDSEEHLAEEGRGLGESYDYEAVLADYRRRQMLAHLTGPVISLVAHAVAIVVCALTLVPSERIEVADVEVNIEELEMKELDPKQLEELRDLEEIPQDVVPAVEKPDVPQEVADVPVTDDFSQDIAETDDDMDLSDVLDIRPSDTKLKLSSLYGGRSNAGRRASVEKYHGSSAGENAVLKGLRWLKDAQNADGSWSESRKEAMCGLALLAYLAHGETPVSEEFGPTVQKAMQYLANRMMALPDGPPSKLSGRVTSPAYTNGVMTYALSEAYGLTKIPFLKPAMERGLRYIVAGQQPRGGYDYGYGYKPDTKRWDLSVSGWQIQAMKAGYVAGAEVQGLVEAFEKAIRFIKKTTYSYSRNSRKGTFGYSSPGNGSWAMQGTGTLCLQLLGEGHSPEAREGVKNIYENHLRAGQVVWDSKKMGNVGHGNLPYAWYYETQAMFHAGKSYWRRWNEQYAAQLIRKQKSNGRWESPKLKDKTPEEWDPCYATCLCCLMLEVYYRYLPTYKMPKPVARGPSLLDIESDDDLGLEIE